ncbi:MAG TPA: bifunctional riboflavin kinase/FAD synthetase [Bryobacteraceae bacterium]|nr:bifunctional riboflavin kinase/FAD synthetase [Bryobacteraceae bacterium]
MAVGSLSITVLGSGTSVGVPTIGCDCDVCHSADPRDNRLRPSIHVSYGGRGILIDTTPDFRQQALRAPIDRVDAILFTHSHADHVMGLDDVRPFNFKQGGIIPIYGSHDTIANIQRSFPYIFDGRESESSRPRLVTHIFDGGPFELFGLTFQPIRLNHGRGTVYGFRFGNAAYLTDHSDIPPESMERLRGLDVLFLDALRHRPHPTHSTVERSLQTVSELKPKRAYFTHICHDLPHAETEKTLPENVRLAYDGLQIQVELAAAVTIGNFDGVHIGHRRLIRRVAEIAREHGWTPALLTFNPHPTRIVAPERAPKLLTTAERRNELARSEGIERIEVLPFTKELSQLTPEEFVKRILVDNLRAKAVVVGDNFRFGNRAAGNVATLRELGKKYGFETEVCHGVKTHGRAISSSEIRRLIQSGLVSRACRMLGRPYALDGEVVSGHGIGSSKTVPTLNLATLAEVLPKPGVFITRTRDLDNARKWNSITNVGYRPTFGGDDHLSIETFLLDPLTGETPRRISVEFLKRIRDEKKFDDAEALKAQILRDVARAQTYFRRIASSSQPALTAVGLPTMPHS